MQYIPLPLGHHQTPGNWYHLPGWSQRRKIKETVLPIWNLKCLSCKQHTRDAGSHMELCEGCHQQWQRHVSTLGPHRIWIPRILGHTPSTPYHSTPLRTTDSARIYLSLMGLHFTGTGDRASHPRSDLNARPSCVYGVLAWNNSSHRPTKRKMTATA